MYLIKKLCAVMLFGITTIANAGQPLVLISNSAPGGNSYTLAKTLEGPLTASGFDVEIEIKLGAGGKIAANYARDKKDVNELLVVGGGIAKFEAVVNSEFTSLLEDYEFVGPVLSTTYWLSANTPMSKDEVFKNNKIYTVGYTNAAVEFIVLQMQKQYPNKFRAVPFKDSKEALVALLGGHIDMHIDREGFFKRANIPTIVALGHSGTGLVNGVQSLEDKVIGLNLTDNASGLMIRKNADRQTIKKIDEVLTAYYNQIKIKSALELEGWTILRNDSQKHNELLIKEITLLKTQYAQIKK